MNEVTSTWQPLPYAAALAAVSIFYFVVYPYVVYMRDAKGERPSHF